MISQWQPGEVRRILLDHGLSAREAAVVLNRAISILNRVGPVDFLGRPLKRIAPPGKVKRAHDEALMAASKARRALRRYLELQDPLASAGDGQKLKAALGALEALSAGTDAGFNRRILEAQPSGRRNKRTGRPAALLQLQQISDLKDLLRSHRGHCRLVSVFLGIDEARVWKASARRQ